MDEELQIKVQAFLDGELSETDAREIGSLIASDADVAALHKELKHTRAALAGFEKRILVPETREFYWSKIEREIERTEAPRPEVQTISLFAYFRRLLVPVALAALVVAVVMVVVKRPSTKNLVTAQAAAAAPVVELADASTFTYRNYAAGATLVWLTYPAENDVAGDSPTTTIQ